MMPSPERRAAAPSIDIQVQSPLWEAQPLAAQIVRDAIAAAAAKVAELLDRSLDVGVGSFFSNLVMFFIILVTALTLHAHGVRAPETSREVADALRPLARQVRSPLLLGWHLLQRRLLLRRRLLLQRQLLLGR